MSPKLLRPVVDVEVLPEAVTGDGSLAPSTDLLMDPSVEDRPRVPSFGGARLNDGVDAPDLMDMLESFRKAGGNRAAIAGLTRAEFDTCGEG